MTFIKAPSDITILEYKYSKHNKKKKVNFLKRLFINCSFFTLGSNCNKLNPTDVINIISNDYSGSESLMKQDHSLGVLNILQTRQKDVEKQVKCKMCSFLGFVLLPLYGYRHFRYYDMKSKIIILPFFAISGIYIGCFFGNIVTGRFSDYRRSKFLGTLPANVFLKNEQNFDK